VLFYKWNRTDLTDIKIFCSKIYLSLLYNTPNSRGVEIQNPVFMELTSMIVLENFEIAAGFYFLKEESTTGP